MGYDAMPRSGASIPAAAAAPVAASRDAGKKKRNHRSAKLKQCKLDARREQWLSQVKGKGDCKVSPGVAKTLNSPPPAHLPRPRPGDVIVKTREGAEDRDDLMTLHESSDLDSPTNNSVLSGNRMRKIFPSNSISSGSSIGSCSRSVSDMEEEEELVGGDEENGVLDDWEAVADALSEDDRSSTCPDPMVPVLEKCNSPSSQSEALHVDNTIKKLQRIQGMPRAWKPDDASRPQSLPSITKQWSFPLNIERHLGASQCKDILSSPCPICYEDLDPTDSSFLPCSCGFHLCLFCHKRILEADGRCPGCRKKYDCSSGEMMNANMVGAQLFPSGLARSCSMNSRF